MEPTLDEYWEAVRRRVCANCIDSDGHGNCLLTDDEECALILHFPKMVEAVLSVKSDMLKPYIDALRSNVCTSCKHQSPDGTCLVRNRVDCGLDRYFPLVVEAVEEVQF
jgi:hypothetical protein